MNLKIIERQNIELSFYILLVMYKNLEINNSKTIKVNKIKKTIKEYINELQEIVDNRFDVDKKIIFDYYDDTNKINKLNGLYTIKNGRIILNNEIDEKRLEEELIKYFDSDEIYNSAIAAIDMNEKLKQRLGFTRIKEKFLIYKEIEDNIESLYNDNKYSYELDKLLEERNKFYQHILSKKDDYISICQEEGTSIDDNNPYNNNYPYNKKYEDIFNEEDELDYNEDEYDEDEIEFMYSVDETLHDPYMYAIFTDYPLSSSRIEEDLNNLILLNNDDKNVISTKRNVIEKYFFMRYIKELEELSYTFNINDYEKTKNRIIYLLDDYKTKLLDKDNFNKEYERLEYIIVSKNKELYFNDDIIDIDNIEWWKDLVIASIEELFNEDKESLKLKKLALIKTYYSITNDLAIVNELKKYSSKKDFLKYASHIMSKGYQKRK